MSLLRQSELRVFLERVLGEQGRLRTGNNLQLHCPFCNHRKRKLELCLDDPYFWHCWTCDAKGKGFFSLLKKLRVPHSMMEELESIVGSQRDFSKNLNFDKPLISFEEPKEAKCESDLQLPEEFSSLTFDDGSRDYKVALAYAVKRKISGCDIVKYNIGYCARGRYQDRLVFPSYDKDNRLNFFSARSYYDDAPLKYLNSQVSKDIIGFENMVDFDYPIYLCEGALDAISLKRNAVPLFGKTLSNRLKTAIIENRCPEVNIVLDDDALPAALKIADFVTAVGRVSKLIRLHGKDPNVLGFEKTRMEVRDTGKLDFAQEIGLRLGF
jgi:DNA primase catalytic core, N-terminal domain